MRRLCCFLLIFSLAVIHGFGKAEDKVAQLEFVDSQNQRIPYCTVLLSGSCNKNDLQSFKDMYLNYLKTSIYDDLIPINALGAGLDISKNTTGSTLETAIDINWIPKMDAIINEPGVKVHQNRVFDKTQFYYCVFLDGTIRTFTQSEVEKLGPGRHQITIPGSLGSGNWAELGVFLVDAAFYWRVDRGDRKALLNRCDALIQRYLKEGNPVWAGNLAFVRALWLRGNIERTGLFGTNPAKVTEAEWKELPWGSKGFFGNLFSAPFGKPIEPYRAFKKALELNPKDPRAIYWVKVSPWLSGAKDDSPEFTRTYLAQAKRVYETYQDQLDDQHRVEALGQVLEFAASSVFVQRYWKKKEGVRVDADQFGWVVKAYTPLVSKYSFLGEEATRWEKLMAYLKDPTVIHTPQR